MALDNMDAGLSYATGNCPPSVEAPAWHSLEDARNAVEAVLRGFLVDLDWLDVDEPKPALVLRVTVGVGKSHIIRMLLAEVAPSVLMRGHILIYVPTHKLAEEAEAAFRNFGTGIPSMVLRGREATNPATGKPMCQKGDLAKRIAQIGASVSTALCQAKKPGTNEFVRAPCRGGCAWYAQFAAEDEHRIVFLPHAYLRSPLPPSIGNSVALRIIDEKCLGDLIWTQSVWVDDWLEPCSCATAAHGGSSTCVHAARSLVLGALLRRQPIVATLQAAGYTRDRLKSFAACELLDQPELTVTPWMAPVAQQWAVDSFDFAAFFRARARARLWSMLVEDWPRGASERVSLAQLPSDSGPPRSVIRLHSRGSIPRDTPLILLDADANPLVTETLVPGAEFVSIDVRPNAEIIQVEDRVFSNASLLTRPGAEERRREILDVVAREAAAARHGVLLVATRDVLRRLRQDVEPACMQPTDDDLMRPLLGAHPRWFGPGMQGVNMYEDFDTAIIIGRLQPRIEAIEDQMRCVFGDGMKPLEFLPFDDPKRGWYAEVESAHLTAHDGLQATTVRGYPDSHGAAILALNREAYTLQAIGRIRAVKPGMPKRILILSSLVMPGLPIDRLVQWQELVTGLSRTELGAKSRRLEAALYPFGRRHSVAGLRLSAAGIKEDAPEAFLAANSANEWRRGLGIEAMRDMIRAIARRRGGRPVFVDLGRPGGGKRTPAVLLDQVDLAGAVARLWPGLELVSIVEEPEQGGASVREG